MPIQIGINNAIKGSSGTGTGSGGGGTPIPPAPATAWGFRVDTSLGGSNTIDLQWNQNLSAEMEVYWGDGNVDTYQWNGVSTASHTYASGGTYDIYVAVLVGTMSGFSILPTATLIDVLRWTNWRGACSNYANLTTITASDEPNWTGTTNSPRISSFFRGSGLSGGIGHWTMIGSAGGSSVFRQCPNFNEDLSGWDTSGWTSMSLTFFAASSWDQDIGMWDISNVSSASQMIESSGLSTANYDKLLIGWAAQAPNIQSGVTFTRGPKYTNAVSGAARAVLVGAPYLWNIVDGGPI